MIHSAKIVLLQGFWRLKKLVKVCRPRAADANAADKDADVDADDADGNADNIGKGSSRADVKRGEWGFGGSKHGDAAVDVGDMKLGEVKGQFEDAEWDDGVDID